MYLSFNAVLYCGSTGLMDKDNRDRRMAKGLAGLTCCALDLKFVGRKVRNCLELETGMFVAVG